MENSCEYYLSIFSEFLKFTSLAEMVGILYQKLHFHKQINFSKDIVIQQLYKNVAIAVYHLNIYRNTLVMYNENNHIQITSLFPEYMAVDQAFIKQYGKNNEPHLSEKNNHTYLCNACPTANEPRKKIRHQSLFDKAKQAEQSKKESIKINNSPPMEKHIENENNQKFRVFQSDKRSYVQIKQDIDAGQLKRDDINPAFILKYQIFKLLDERGSIDFTSDAKIKEEYDIFYELYQVCLENDDDDSCVKEPNNVYIPHNWNYMTDEQKEAYVKKCKMTLPEFNACITCTMEKSSEGEAFAVFENMHTLDSPNIQR